ncbi:hypothetical protein VTJ49DRAFT_3829 [Mycothermus thermophilus]|uniref:Uncharacterized protein n=1 Tax=Humicola insolens TaxID=85995 RepID=A0ABR3VRK8_HUMIN
MFQSEVPGTPPALYPPPCSLRMSHQQPPTSLAQRQINDMRCGPALRMLGSFDVPVLAVLLGGQILNLGGSIRWSRAGTQPGPVEKPNQEGVSSSLPLWLV